MLRLSFLIIFSIFSFAFANYGQMCGHGTYTINFIPKSKFDFKLISLSPKNQDYFSQGFHSWFSKMFPQKDLGDYQCCNMTQIKRKPAEKFLKNYKKDDFRDMKELGYLPNKFEGSSETASIKFNTVETLQAMIILKISSKKYGKFYFIGNFLGGCPENGTFDLSKNK